MIFGDSPGEEEYRQGITFVGPSGSFLCSVATTLHYLIDPVLEKYQGEDDDHPDVHQVLDDNFYMTNAVLCWPGDRKPTKREYTTCRDRLRNEIYLVDPELIITFGKQAAESVLGHSVAITNEHGKMFKARMPARAIPYIEYPVMTLVHPSFVLREGDSSGWINKFAEGLESALKAYHTAKDTIMGDSTE